MTRGVADPLGPCVNPLGNEKWGSEHSPVFTRVASVLRRVPGSARAEGDCHVGFRFLPDLLLFRPGGFSGAAEPASCGAVVLALGPRPSCGRQRSRAGSLGQPDAPPTRQTTVLSRPLCSGTPAGGTVLRAPGVCPTPRDTVPKPVPPGPLVARMTWSPQLGGVAGSRGETCTVLGGRHKPLRILEARKGVA